VKPAILMGLRVAGLCALLAACAPDSAGPDTKVPGGLQSGTVQPYLHGQFGFFGGSASVR
jgi:hypothetical protein